MVSRITRLAGLPGLTSLVALHLDGTWTPAETSCLYQIREEGLDEALLEYESPLL